MSTINPQPPGTEHSAAPMVVLAALALARADAARCCSLGITAFSAAVQAKILPQPRRINGRSVWVVAELQAALMRLPVSDLLPPPMGRRGKL